MVTISLAAIGYVLRGLHKDIGSVDKSAKERHEVHSQALRDIEARSTAYIHDVEARNVKRVEDAEIRAEKGDERVLREVNSQYSELRKDVRDMRDDVKALTQLASANAGAANGNRA